MKAEFPINIYREISVKQLKLGKRNSSEQSFSYVFTYLVFHSFIDQLFSAFHIPVTFVTWKDTAVNKTDTNICL